MTIKLEDIGYPSGANAVAEPSDLGQVKGAKKQKSSVGVARVKNKIDTRPKIENKKILVNENKFIENNHSHAVIGFGRFNPPHLGHQKLVDKIRSHAALVGGTPHLFLSHSEGNVKNPIPYHKKLKLMKKAFGDVVNETEAKNPYDIAKSLSGKFDHLTMVAGSDRIPHYTEMLARGQGKDFNFKTINFISSGDREKGGISATQMRKWAQEGNHKDFEANLPEPIRHKSKKIMKAVAKGISEELSLVHEKSYPPAKKHPGILHSFVIHNDKEPIGQVLATHHPEKKHLHIQYAELDKEHQGKHSLAGALKGLKKHFPDVKSVSAKRITGRHTGDNTYKVSEEISESGLISLLGKYLDKVDAKISEKAEKSLQEKAENSNFDFDIIMEAYQKGIEEWTVKQDQTFLTAEQWAFNRVNSFINENVMVYKFACSDCNKNYSSRHPKQDCPTCKKPLQITVKSSEGSSRHPTNEELLVEEKGFNHHASACTKCGKIYNNYRCAFTCKHPVLRIGRCDKCKGINEEHGAGFQGTSKLTKKYAKDTPGQSKLKIAYNKYVEDKFVKEELMSEMLDVKRDNVQNLRPNSPETLHDFSIHHEGKQIGRVYTMHMPKSKTLDIGGFYLKKEHEGKHSLTGVVKKILKHFPDVKRITGDRVTGRHRGDVEYKNPIHEGIRDPDVKYAWPDSIDKEKRKRMLKIPLKNLGGKPSRGTGTERQNKWEAMKKEEGWIKCKHECQIHGKWEHDVPKEFGGCHKGKYSAQCPNCFIIPYNPDNPKKVPL